MKVPNSVLTSKYIAIDGSALVKKNKTGVEWYGMKLLKYLSLKWKTEDLPVVIFIPQKRKISLKPDNWYIHAIPQKPFWTQYHLLKFLKKYPPKVFLSPTYIAPRFLNSSAINSVHGLEGEHFKEFEGIKEKIIKHILVKPSLKKNKIISVSSHTQKDLKKYYNLSSQVILSGVGTLDDNKVVKILKTSGDIKKSNAQIDLLFLGGLNPRKNLSGAALIFRQFKKLTKKPIKLTILGGSKKDAAKINYSIQNSPFKKDIVHIPYVTNAKKEELLAKSHFLLYPSYYEGFGFPILEAQTFGAIPVVMKNSGLTETGGEGILEYFEGEEKKVANEMLKMINNVEEYRKMRKVGVNNVRKYSWDRCAKELKRVILGK